MVCQMPRQRLIELARSTTLEKSNANRTSNDRQLCNPEGCFIIILIATHMASEARTTRTQGSYLSSYQPDQTQAISLN